MDIKRLLFVILAMTVLLIAVGCENMQSGASTEMAKPQRAVFVSGGNGGGTVIYLPSADGKSVVMLSDGKGQMCPDCQAAAIKYFDTGVLDPKCPTCGTHAPPSPSRHQE